MKMENNEEKTETLELSLINLYTDKKELKFRSKYSLKNDPPLLFISSKETGESVKFPLSYTFNQELLHSLTDVNKAYLGIQPTKKNKIMDEIKKDSLFSTIKNTFIEGRLLLLELFIGMILGVMLTNGIILGVIVSLLAGVGALFFAYTNKSPKKNVKMNDDKNIMGDKE